MYSIKTRFNIINYLSNLTPSGFHCMVGNMGAKSSVARSGKKNKQPSLTINLLKLPHKNKPT